MTQILTEDSFAGAMWVCMQNPKYIVGVCFQTEQQADDFEKHFRDNISEYDTPIGTQISYETHWTVTGITQTITIIILPNRSRIYLCSARSALICELKFNAILYGSRMNGNLEYKLENRAITWKQAVGLGDNGKFVRPVDWRDFESPELNDFLESFRLSE